MSTKKPNDPFEDFNPIMLTKKETAVLVVIILVLLGTAAYEYFIGF